MNKFYRVFLFFLYFSNILVAEKKLPFVTILGVAQDGGAPHAGCIKICCKNLWDNMEAQYMVSCIGITVPKEQSVWMVDATPDFPKQLHNLTNGGQYKLNGIFLTHAHIGHYTGLIYLGREVMAAKYLPVYVMPKMKLFLEKNGPWNQLISLKQINLLPLSNKKFITLNDQISIIPFLVPHRDEYSETVGFRIIGPNKTLVFIPDIDKWDKWQTSISDIIIENDYILIDGTFFGGDEIPNRDMGEIPHPFIEETINQLASLSKRDKNKIYFIHINHSNPVLDPLSIQNQKVQLEGFNISYRGKKFYL